MGERIITVSRAALVDGRPVKVFDGLVSVRDVQSFFEQLLSSPFTRSEVARPDTQAFRHWAINFSLPAFQKMPLYQPTLLAVSQYFGDYGRLVPYRVYCNMSSYGDMLFTHTDALPGDKELTALWFITPRWDIEWGGETLFFNTRTDAEFVVSPSPGRLVLFDGAIRHAGRPPSRICTQPRFTFAVKFEHSQNP